MSDKEFWQAVYIQAIASGQPPIVARGYANDALSDMMDKWRGNDNGVG